MSRKNLYENIAATYFNIVSLNEQFQTSVVNNKVADTLLQIVKNKYNLGLAKQQDVNTANVSLLNSEESAYQIYYLMQQQYIALKILCDIPEAETISISHIVKEAIIKANYSATQNKLKATSSRVKEKIADIYYRQLKYSYLPTVSAFASNSYQQFSTQFKTFDSSLKWMNSNYIGIKAVLALPSSNSVTQASKARYDYLLAQENSVHAQLESNLEFSRLGVDHAKAVSQYKTHKKIVFLQSDSYYKNLALYHQGLIGLDALMDSFNAKVTSEYNLNASIANVLLSQSKIDINNLLK